MDSHKVQRQGEHLAFLPFQIPSDAVLSSTLSSSLGDSGLTTSPRHHMDITMSLPAQAPDLRNVFAEDKGMRGRGAQDGLRAWHQELHTLHCAGATARDLPVLST